MFRGYFLLQFLILTALVILAGCQASGGGAAGGGGILSPPNPAYTTTISGTSNHIADNVDASTITITVFEGATPIVGVVPTYTVSGSNNFISACSATDATGTSTCSLKSTRAEVKSIKVAMPNVSTSSSVTFLAGPVSTTSTIASAGPVVANGVSAMTINVSLKDAFGNAVSGITPTFDATNTGTTNSYGACTVSSASGSSICSMTSTKAEVKTLRITSPVTANGGPAFFFAGPPVAANTTIGGTTPHNADGVDASIVTVTMRDAFMNPALAVVPTFSASGTGNVLSACSSSDFTGVSTCTLRSTDAGVKNLALVTPLAKAGNAVSFNGVIGSPVAANSTITGTTPVLADGVATSTITITLRDSANSGVPGIVPTFGATNTGSSNTYGVCSATDASGVSTCTLSSTYVETKTLAISTPVVKVGGTTTFVPGPASAVTSTITGTSPVAADGTATSTISINIRDAFGNGIAGETPTFSATDTGFQNDYGACSVTNAAGLSTCTLKSTIAETKTLQLLSPVTVTGGTVIFMAGAAVAANSTITGTSPKIADGIDSSTITITLRDASNNPVAGQTPTFSATDTGTDNTYGLCSVTNASGVSTCSLKSLTAETKTLSIATPVVKADGTVVFSAAGASVANSTITGTGPVIANGVAVSNITITLNDASNNPIVGTTPTFSATNNGTTNVYSACSATNSSGVSTCTLTSTKAETKTLAITSPINKADGTVAFIAGPAAAANSTVTGSSPVVADGTATSTVTITLLDAFNNPVGGETPTFSATDTGSTNVYGTCSATSSFGISTCNLSSTKAETKTLSIATPVVKADGTVIFTAGSPVAANSSISGTTPVIADGTATSTVSVVLQDANSNPVSGVVPTFTATDSGNTNIYGVCSSSDATGTSTCTLASLFAESKTLSIATPVVKAGTNVVFTAAGASVANSTITGTGPVVADGVATSTVTITLKDSANNPVPGETPTFSATDSGTTNAYSVCSVTDASGISTCTLTSLKAESKTLSITAPVVKAGGNVNFIAGPAVAANSSITGSSPVIANGSATSTVTITLRDANNNPVSGTAPTFSATDTGSTNVYGSCNTTDVTGAATCTLTSLKAEVKTLSIVTPVAKVDGSVTFVAGPAVAANSSISGSGPVVADGTSTSTVTITLMDANNNPVSGDTPTFSATNTGNSNNYGTCSATDASGVSTCTLASANAETKTLSIATPVVKAGGTVVFTPGSAVAANSTITGTGPVTADGASTSTIVITLRDAGNNPVAGITPTFSATDTGTTNAMTACSATNASGISICSLTSTKAETKTLAIVTPVAKTDGTVVFRAGAVDAANSSITGTGPVTADGTATSTVTITLNDAFNNPVSSEVPTFSASDLGSTNIYGTCSATNTSGISTCTLASLKAQTKTLSITSPVFKSDGTVVFTGGTPVAANSTITGTGPVTADGSATSTVTITLQDANNNPVEGQVPTFTATDTGSSNVYGVCSATNSTGQSVCTLASGSAETKTLSIATPVTKTGGTVIFTAGSAVAVNSTITGTGPVLANGVATSTVTITLRDAGNNPVTGIVPTFTATNTGAGNTYGTCSSTNSSGVSTCTLRSTKAEVKTLSIATPIVKADGTVTFNAGSPVAGNSTIAGSGPVVADGIATSTITITLRDANNNLVSGSTPTFSSSGLNNTLGTCSLSDSSGVSTCTLRSTRAQLKNLGILTPVAKPNAGTVTFIAGAASADTTTITGTTPVSADGVSTSFISITIQDVNSNPITGVVPIFNATNTSSANVYGACSASDASGLSMCTLASTRAEMKTLQLTSPVGVTGDIVEFSSSLPTAANSTISGTSPHAADGSTDSTITITLRDGNNNPVPGIEPTFDATNTGSGNTYDTCSLSDASGISQCTMQSTVAEIKTLRITAPVTKLGGNVTFTAGPAVAATSTITGTSTTVADNVQTSSITITLKDANGNGVSGQTPTFTATGTSNTYGACSASNATGVSTCTLRSTKAEVKTLSIATPFVKAGGTVTFIGGTPVAANSTITGTGPTNPDGVALSTITITLKDVNNNNVSSVTPTFSASGTNNFYNACSATNASGVSTCSMRSTTAQIKTLSIVTPVAKAGGTVEFATGSPDIANSSITASGPVVANNTATSVITITLKDNANVPVIGIVPTFDATGSNNSYSACSATNSSGVSTCTMTSTKAEDKVVSIATPIIKEGDTVTFIAGPASAASSTIECDASSYKADNVDTCNVKVTIRDQFSNAREGDTPTISVSGTSNTVSTCSATDSAGESVCTLKSSKAEGKFLSIVTPVAVTNPTEYPFYPNGIDIQIPIEMLDRGLIAPTTAYTFLRSRTSLNTNDYIGDTVDYFFEVVASNTNGSPYVINLVDETGTNVPATSFSISNTSAARRFRWAFNPLDGDHNYRIRTPNAASSALRIHSARIIVQMANGVEAKLYVPMASADVTSDVTNDSGSSAQIMAATTASYTQSTTTGLMHYLRTDSLYDAIPATNSWTLEALISSSSTVTGSAILFDRVANAPITQSEVSVTNAAVTLGKTTFSSNATNFNDGDTLEVRFKSSSTSTTRLYKVGLWIKVRFMKKAESYWRLSQSRRLTSGGTTAATLPDGRFLYEAAQYSNPSTHYLVMGANSTVRLLDMGTSDTTTTGTTVSTVNAGATYGRTLNAVTLTSNDRYTVSYARTTGTSLYGGGYVIIRSQE